MTDRNIQWAQRKTFQITLPTGKKESIELTEKEIKTVKNWFHLVGKHKLRLNIMNVLQIYDEMNISQISKNVEHSKSTVDRHLKLMEEDGLLVSRKADSEEFGQGKIPPRVFRRNNKLLKVLQYIIPEISETDDPSKRVEFYRNYIDSYREHIRQYISFYEKTGLIFQKIENNLDDVDIARDLWMRFFEEKLTPARLTMNMLSISEKYHFQILMEYKKFLKNIREILAVQNVDPEVKEREFTAIFSFLPVKDMFDLYREQKLKKRKSN